MLPHGQGSDFYVLRTGLFSYLVHSLGASADPGMETLMVAPLVTLVVMLPFLSIPTWSVDLTLAEQVHCLQLIQVPHIPPNFSLGIDSFSFEMIDVSSWSGTSLVAHKWYNY